MLGTEKLRREALARDAPQRPATQAGVDSLTGIAAEGRDEAKRARRDSEHTANWVDAQWMEKWRSWPRRGRWLAGVVFVSLVGAGVSFLGWLWFQRGRG